MRVAVVIAGRILRQRLRDRSAIIFAVLTPLGLALAFSAVIPDSVPTFHTTVRRRRRGPRRRGTGAHPGTLDGLVKAGIADVRTLASEADARIAVSADEVGAAVIIPAGFTEAVHDGTLTRLRILGGECRLA